MLRPYRVPIAIGTFSILATQAAQAWLPMLFRNAVAALEGPRPDTDLALGWSLVFLLVTAIRGAFQWTMRRTIVGASRDLERDLRDTLFDRVVRQSPAWVSRHHTGDLMSRFTSDVEAVRMSVGPGLMYLANTVAVLPWAIGMMVAMSPVLAAMNLVPLALLAAGTRWVSPRLHAASTDAQEAQAALSTKAQESFAGVRVVKSFAREEAESAQFRERAGRALDAAIRTADTQSVFYPLVGLLKWLGFVLTVFVGGRMMARGEMTLATFLAFHMYATMLLWPMISLGWVLAMWERGKVAMGRIAAVLESEPSIASKPGASRPPAPAAGGASIEVRNLVVRHEGAARNAVDGVSFSVPPGRTLAITGATGSGKSTVLATIPRLADPPPGTVFVDGTPVEDWPLDALRARMGFVPQDTFLFSETVGENIGLGLAEPSPERVRAAAAAARIDAEIAALPQAYATLLGERGVNLSGGQRQRTAIARALVRDPAILLLDDCLSAVDARTEAEILANLRDVIRGRTTILVTHRAAAAKLADEVVVMDEGRIVERGAPAALLAGDGPFARLARRQTLEDRLEAA
ncbi:MAG: putative multidrug resistance ABC transporter ATP-binding/permease protein YheI [Planctomycetes bacterium]|nr:putative multidrug resistance ABC transporter ATP-binding/permease protein YheI [Planctomycetota bacterium]